MARVSFLMSLYNGAEFLAETMQSLLAQDYDDFDILIIDDGSTDDWQNVIDRFKTKKIRVHSQANRGLVESLNTGLELLDCEMIARADADDIYFPHRLSHQLEFMDFAGLDGISNRIINIDTLGYVRDFNEPGSSMWLADPFHFPALEPYLPHPFLTAKLKSMHEVGGYRHAHLSEDADLCWRLARQHKIFVHEEPIGKYRIHASSISSNALNRGRVQAFYGQLAALNEQRFRAGKVEIEYFSSLQGEVDKAVSIDALVQPYAARLNDKEITWLKAATAAKLLDLGGWRNYRLNQGDLKDVIAKLGKVKITDHKHRLKLRGQITYARKRQKVKIWDGQDMQPSFWEKLWNKRPIS